MARPGGEELERHGVGQSRPGRCECLRDAAGGEPVGTFGYSSGVARLEWTLWREVSGHYPDFEDVREGPDCGRSQIIIAFIEFLFAKQCTKYFVPII